MIPAQSADGIDDLAHFRQQHSIQNTVQLMEILFDLVIVYSVHIAVSLVEQRKDRFAFSQIQFSGFSIGFQRPELFFHVHTQIISS